MARMIPAIIDARDAAPGEVELFTLLQRDAPVSWTVLHSLDLPRHIRQIEGELDFLVLIPGLAAICVEVKSHQRVLRDTSGLWRLGNDPPSARSPFQQVSEAMHSTRKRLSDEASLSGVPFTSVVVFPRCRFDVPAIEWEPWQVIDEPDLSLSGITGALRRVGQRTRDKLRSTPSAGWFDEDRGEPTAAHCERIVAVLRPAFERSRSPKARRAEAEGEIRRYTSEQFEALDELEANRRVVFTGAAGTGKTFIALEAARRASAVGQRVLLCCYNRLLGKWLQREAAPLGDRVTTGTLHSIMRAIADPDIPPAPSPAFWASTLPALTADRLLSGHPDAGAYDVAIVDEAQDVCTPDYLDVIDLLVDGGLRDGRLLAFGDFEHQSIYTGNDSREHLAGRTSSAAFKLRVNCRNRPRIGYVASTAFGRDPYRRYRRADDGVQVTMRPYAYPGQQSPVMCDLIETLRNEGYQLGDISILSPSATNAAWEALPRKQRAWCADAAHATGGKIQTSTVHAFKGLEAAAMIITDLDDLSTTHTRQLLYVAVTRATDRLALCVQDNAIQHLESLLMGNQP